MGAFFDAMKADVSLCTAVDDGHCDLKEVAAICRQKGHAPVSGGQVTDAFMTDVATFLREYASNGLSISFTGVAVSESQFRKFLTAMMRPTTDGISVDLTITGAPMLKGPMASGTSDSLPFFGDVSANSSGTLFTLG